MIYEQDNIGFPKLEPFVESEMSLNFTQDNLGTIDLLLRDLYVEGLSSFTVPNLRFNVFNLDFYFHFHFPKITATGWYSIDGDVEDFIALTGSGDMLLEVEDVNIYIDGNQGHDTTLNTWWLNRLKVDADLAKTSGYLKGIMNDEVLEDFITYLINNSVSRFLDALWPDIEPEIVQMAMDGTPDLLDGLTLEEFLDTIALQRPLFMELPDGECPIPDF